MASDPSGGSGTRITHPGGLDRALICWDLHAESIGALWTVAAAHDDHILDMQVAAPDALVTCSRDRVWQGESGEGGEQRERESEVERERASREREGEREQRERERGRER